MKYISGFQALNLECPLNTPGDWHQDNIDWNNINLLESDDSQFKDWGIFVSRKIPGHIGEDFFVANHIRAILDILQTKSLNELKGFRHDFICDETLNNTIFEKVFELKNSPNWDKIDKIMSKEYYKLWRQFKEKM